MNSLRRLLHLQPGDGKKVLPFFLAFFFFYGFITLATTARDTYFLSRFDPDFLPYLMVIMAILVAITISLVTRFSGKIPLSPQITVTFLLSAASLLLLQLSLTTWLYPVLYVWIQIIATVMLVQLWLLANSLFTSREAKRMFGLIGCGSAIASTVLGFSIGSFVSQGLDLLLPTGALCLLLSLLALLPTRHFSTTKPEASPRRQAAPAVRPAKNGPAASRYLRILGLTVACSAVVGAFIDYQMKILVSQELGEQRMASLFGYMYGTIGIVSIFVQFFLTGWLLSKLGILWGLTLLPAALFLGSGFLLLAPTVLASVLAKAGDNIFRFTITDTSNQLLWLPVSPLEKHRAKPFIDGTIKNGATGLAGLVILVIALFQDTIALVSLLSLGVVGIWAFANFRLKKGYVQELSQAIDKRHLQLTDLSFDATDPAVVASIRKALSEGDEHQQLFTFDLLAQRSLTAWKSDLLQLLHSGSPAVRSQVLTLTEVQPDIIPDALVTSLIHDDDDELATKAIISCGRRRNSATAEALANVLQTGNDRRKAAAAASLVFLASPSAGVARAAISRMLFASAEQTQLSALSSIGHLSSIISDDDLALLLRADSCTVRNKAAQLAIGRDSASLIPPLVQGLADPSTLPACRRALRTFDHARVAEQLDEVLGDEGAAAPLLVGAIRASRDYRDAVDIRSIMRHGFAQDLDLADESIRCLEKLAQLESLPKDILSSADELLEHIAHQAYHELALSVQFENDKRALLINDYLATHAARRKLLLIKLALLPFPDHPIDNYAHVLTAGTRWERADLVELLDNLRSLRNRELLLPLFEDSAAAAKATKGRRFLREQPGTSVAITRWLSSGDPWPATIALDYTLQSHLIDVALDWDSIPRLQIIREVCCTDWQQDDSMLKTLTDFPASQFLFEDTPTYSTLEKTILLKGIDIFSLIPGEQVAHIAEIAEQRTVRAGETLFEEGDPGKSMFMVLEGSLQVARRGKQALLALSRGDSVGHLALLAHEPRAVTATAIHDSTLLEIHEEAFYELLAGRFEILQSLVTHLSKRLFRYLEQL